MLGNQRTVIQGEENYSVDGTNQESTYSTNPHPADVTSATAQVDQKPISVQNKVESKPEGQTNLALSRLLIGGLIGATVGAIAGALANRKTSQGFDHAVRGIDRASKTIGAGLSHAASGVVDATKSVGEGVSYAIGGSTQDTAQGIAQGTQQVKTVAAEAAQTTADQVGRAVKGVAEGAQQAKTATLEAVQTTAERASRTVQEASETLKATDKKADDSVQGAIAQAPSTQEVMLVQPEPSFEPVGIEPVTEVQDIGATANAEDDLDIALINALQEEEDRALNGYFISAEEISQEEAEKAIQEDVEGALQEYLFADVEVSRPDK